MKKILSYLTLTAFAVVSHMSVVHAWDMFGMGMETEHGHSMKTEQSIFCSDSPTDQSASDCAKDPITDKRTAITRSEARTDFEAKKIPRFTLAETSIPERHPDTKSVPTPPPRPEESPPKERSSYAARIGEDVKKLD